MIRQRPQDGRLPEDLRDPETRHRRASCARPPARGTRPARARPVAPASRTRV